MREDYMGIAWGSLVNEFLCVEMKKIEILREECVGASPSNPHAFANLEKMADLPKIFCADTVFVVRACALS